VLYFQLHVMVRSHFYLQNPFGVVLKSGNFSRFQKMSNRLYCVSLDKVVTLWVQLYIHIISEHVPHHLWVIYNRTTKHLEQNWS